MKRVYYIDINEITLSVCPEVRHGWELGIETPTVQWSHAGYSSLTNCL